MVKRKITSVDKMTFDVHFNDDSDSNNMGFKMTLQKCIDYINHYNGLNHGYFKTYKSGVVSVVCNETGETMYETFVK